MVLMTGKSWVLSDLDSQRSYYFVLGIKRFKIVKSKILKKIRYSFALYRRKVKSQNIKKKKTNNNNIRINKSLYKLKALIQITPDYEKKRLQKAIMMFPLSMMSWLFP